MLKAFMTILLFTVKVEKFDFEKSQWSYIQVRREYISCV
jgi:hypothetical protein